MENTFSDKTVSQPGHPSLMDEADQDVHLSLAGAPWLHQESLRHPDRPGVNHVRNHLPVRLRGLDRPMGAGQAGGLLQCPRHHLGERVLSTSALAKELKFKADEW